MKIYTELRKLDIIPSQENRFLITRDDKVGLPENSIISGLKYVELPLFLMDFHFLKSRIFLPIFEVYEI